MSFYEIILWLSAVGVVLGGIDHLLGDRFGLGAKFVEGFQIMSTLAIASAGIIVLAPVLVEWLQPVLLPDQLDLVRSMQRCLSRTLQRMCCLQSRAVLLGFADLAVQFSFHRLPNQAVMLLGHFAN